MGGCCSCSKPSDANTEAIKGVENSALENENDGSGYGSKTPKSRATGKNKPSNSFEMCIKYKNFLISLKKLLTNTFCLLV